MELYQVRVKIVHPDAYRPNGCETAVITGVFWNKDTERLCYQLTYDNGAIDWIPTSSLNGTEYKALNGT